MRHHKFLSNAVGLALRAHAPEMCKPGQPPPVYDAACRFGNIELALLEDEAEDGFDNVWREIKRDIAPRARLPRSDIVMAPRRRMQVRANDLLATLLKFPSTPADVLEHLASRGTEWVEVEDAGTMSGSPATLVRKRDKPS